MKKITLLFFALVSFTMSAQYNFDLSSLPYTNNSGVTYDGGTQTISWDALGGTGAMGYIYASGSYLDASAYTYLNIYVTSVTGRAGTNGPNPPNSNEGAVNCRVTYNNGTVTTQQVMLTTSASPMVYNLLLGSAKATISQIEFRLFGGTPATVKISSMNLSTSAGTLGVQNFEELASLKTYTNDGNLVVENAENIKNVSVYSISGQVVANVAANSTTVSIPTNNLSKGVYMVKVDTEKGSKTVKIVK